MNTKPLTKTEVIEKLKNVITSNLGTEKINLFQSENRILAEPIISKIPHPPFNNSAVDGYALHNDDVKNNDNKKISHRITAGDNNEVFLNPGEVARIFTGAKMPSNSDTVVMQENVEKNNDYIKIIKYPKLGENCRLAGEDIKKDSKILEAGDKITSRNISLIAAIGKKFIKVKKKLKVGYFTSGNELFDPTENLLGSKINNSNKYTLMSLLNQQYIDSNYLGVLKDSKEEILKLFKNNLSNYSVIITAGGASVGEEDYLIDVIKENGELFFWQVAIKPGRPLAIGKIKNTFFICLPGNPVSVYLLFGMIVKSFLEYLCGSKMITPPFYYATVNFEMRKKTERLEWLRVNINNNFKSGIFVDKYLKQGSGMISSIAYADGIIEIPENVSLIKKGDKFKLFLFNDIFY